MPQKVEPALGYIGRKTLAALKGLHKVSILINEVFEWTLISPLRGKPPRFHATVKEMVKTGYESVLVVVVIAFFVGAILALQSAYQLKKFGAMIYVADLVGVAITRELGPIITAIIIAGRSGSAFAAEIGSMKAQEEVDALLSMGIHPIRFLVVPKLIAMMIMQPALTTFFDVVGMFGGFTLSTTLLDVNAASYFNETIKALQISDLVTGLVKAWAFSVLITITGAYHGFQVNAGAEEVGRRTTASVVTSIFMVIFFDLFFTTLFYYFT
ncbi:MlaE family ABC transporter permease [Candidatus Magnetominusculus dajiuhuensis]|uniref:MlaE family ABC transporter permease n=1 Tax=Candidatus Magnetominusculus dajiuhuensis TaxID=3137712 RepID=UPI003B42EB27